MNAKILLADDHPVLCSGLRVEICRKRGLEVVGQARTGPEAIRLARDLAPDLMIMDFHLPGVDGLLLVESVRRLMPAPKILVFSDNSDLQSVEASMELGAAGYLLKSCTVAELLEAVGTVIQGRTWVSPRIGLETAKTTRKISADGRRRGGPVLSEKEELLLRLLAAGKQSKEMAPTLNLSLASVDTYRLRLRRKLGCRNTAELVRYALVHQIGDL